VRALVASVVAALAIAAPSFAPVSAQAPAAAAARRSAQASAPTDLTGTWVSVITEDWQWRMATPPKWDYRSVPLNQAGQKLMGEWEPGMETSCKAYGAAHVLRQPGRVRISWENENTLKIETDAGRPPLPSRAVSRDSRWPSGNCPPPALGVREAKARRAH
jgi:hypothetical protein